jgi:hypothetical protein
VGPLLLVADASRRVWLFSELAFCGTCRVPHGATQRGSGSVLSRRWEAQAVDPGGWRELLREGNVVTDYRIIQQSRIERLRRSARSR